MNDDLEPVRDHYRASGLTQRLKAALTPLGPESRLLTPQQLGALDQFHTLGLVATAELAQLAGLNDTLSVLDVGCGVGGPARFLAHAHGCRVTGVDLSESFVDAARYLTGRTGQSGQVTFQTGNALALPFGAGSFDAVLLQHVAMNVSDRPALYREIRRVLKPGGKLATFDVVSKDADPHYPVPWARSPSTSFLLSASATQAAIEAAGFQTLIARDDTASAQAWAARLRSPGPPASPNLGVVMGPDFAELLANHGRNLLEGRLGIFTAVFESDSRAV